MTLIIVAIIVVVLISWIISVQRRLVAMDENINNAMSQIGVQLSSRFDALTALLDLTKGYAAHEATTLIETIKSRRSVITATSTPQDVRSRRVSFPRPWAASPWWPSATPNSRPTRTMPNA